MSLLKGNDLRSAFIETDQIRARVCVTSKVDAVTGATNITGVLNFASLIGHAPPTFGSVVGNFSGLDVSGADGYPGQVVSFASFVSGFANFPITNIGPDNSVHVAVVPVASFANGITSGSVGGQILCVGHRDWRIISTAGISITSS